MKTILTFFFLFLLTNVASQNLNYTATEITINKHIGGTLLSPVTNEQPKLAIIIADSGPTDRNGNQNLAKNGVLKKLAESLSKEGIATFRYDKRIVKQIRNNKVDPNITFDDFIADAINVIEYFKTIGSYRDIYIIGHGQGSLVGMLAAKGRADGFISLAGAGQSIDEVITSQIANMDPSLVEGTKTAFESLKKGKLTNNYPPALASVFRADVQPFIMTWMQYNPQDIIKSLEIPVLIINGTKDLQVPVEDAELLTKASNRAELQLIEKMNHVLFIIEGDELENSKSYNESYRKISGDLVAAVIQFIEK
ncbi:hypothetical protein SAMN04515667_1189 [Formosa sp. Hel1_31_208]|uniref:alpha/beta hydrolase n=1 Tax=Formosa sp. Hel1_31_208 TaxID=1798225 RepID=UPI00087B6945|nr:alpha/beta hydrolase [Formosa sp. Hel1_31_208]SDS00459.1 hypothetical protein SAMN04515667_1189 [Formosa sp. Hel1_31_208]